MKLLLLILLPVFCLGASHEPPTGPQGPEGTFLRYNLLDPFPGGRLGAFNTRDWEPGTLYIFREKNLVPLVCLVKLTKTGLW